MDRQNLQMKQKQRYQNGWIERALSVQPSELGMKVERILAYGYRGIYHISKEVSHKRVDWTDEYYIRLVVRANGNLSTIDSDTLTRLVLCSLSESVRLSIGGAANGYVDMTFSSRPEQDLRYVLEEYLDFEA